jgi:hypothetical protein
VGAKSDKSEFEGLAKPFFESFDKTFLKVFCDPTVIRWSPVATGEISTRPLLL